MATRYNETRTTTTTGLDRSNPSYTGFGSGFVQILAPECTQMTRFAGNIKWAGIVGVILALVIMIVASIAIYNVSPPSDSDGTVAESDDAKKKREKRLKQTTVIGLVASIISVILAIWSAYLGTRIKSCIDTGRLGTIA